MKGASIESVIAMIQTKYSDDTRGCMIWESTENCSIV